jgi:hypothetical protein
LDNELEVPENLAILEHLNHSSSCAAIYSTEEMAWDRVAILLAEPSAPLALKSRIPAIITKVDRANQFRRFQRWIIPAAAAAGLLAIVALNFPTHATTNDQPSTNWPTPHAHGVMMSRVIDHWTSATGKKGSLDMAYLEKHAHYRPVCNDSLPGVLREIFGDCSCKILQQLSKSGMRMADGSMILDGKSIRNCMISTPKVEIGVYILDRKAAELADLHLVDDDISRGVRIERCRSCSVIAISKGDKVVLLVTGSESAIDPLVDVIASGK